MINNELATAFADSVRQAQDPAYVLVPQRKPSQGSWAAPEMTAVMLELVEWAKDSMAVDGDRVYVTGNSMAETDRGRW